MHKLLTSRKDDKMITLFKKFQTKYNKAYKDDIYEMLPDKHIQLSTGFTQDSFGITSTTVNK
jgi:hypothetical protein